MNKIYIILLSATMFLFVGCNDFLEESSQDEVRPSTVDDLTQLFLGEGYPVEQSFLGYLDLMTDDVKCNGVNADPALANQVVNGRSVFAWEFNMYEEMHKQGVGGVNSWVLYYKKIMGCNLVLDYVDEMVGSVDNKENLKGQALAMRAYYYFMLVNLYGQPYNNKDIDITKSLAVPLMLKSEVEDAFPVRNTVDEVYKQILTDLKEATSLLEKYTMKTSIYKATDLFAHTLYSRVYMYMEKWDKVIEHCDAVFEKNNRLTSLTFLLERNGDSVDENVYTASVSQEVIWGYSGENEYGSFFEVPNLNMHPAYGVSDELRGLYDYDKNNSENKRDLRPHFYYKKYIAGIDWSTWSMLLGDLVGNKAGNGMDPSKGMRVAEVYLNIAEAYVRKYIETGNDDFRTKALGYLNTLRESRYDTRNVAYLPVDITGKDELLKFYKEERRRELAFEDHRWFDLRRYGMPELKHSIPMEGNTTEEYVLNAKSLSYVLPIPKEVLDKNTMLMQNNR